MRNALFLLLLVGCAEPAAYQYGLDLTELEFVPYSPDEGVYPDESVLVDPNNPFAGGIGDQAKWDVFASGPVHGFYAMAQSLVQIPTGEHQFYTAYAAHGIYAYELAEPEDLYMVYDIAVRGYRTVLEEFIDDVTYDPSGTYAWYVAPLAYLGLEELGGDTSGYALITADDGTLTVVEVP
ncbi:MAG: hypothetical protein JXB39_12700 [Deltaproteobacteria bacterium]|nr:hypothetical protein [Deltaproteobacteria bacterium]